MHALPCRQYPLGKTWGLARKCLTPDEASTIVPQVNRVREYREKRGLTQQQLAEAAGVSVRTISYVESGRDVKVSTMRDIARALGVQVSTLVPEEVPAA